MSKFRVARESQVVQGHVLDVARAPLLAALRRYDPLLYVQWNPKKRGGRGCWELRRRPEFKSLQESRFLDTPRGRVFIPGDVYEVAEYTICVPKYHETHFENHVKDFDYLTYEMVEWLADHDLWDYGYKGKNVVKDAEYNEAKFDEKIDNDAAEERSYMIKQHRTEFNDFREYVLAGGNPYRLMDYWGK